MRAGCAVEGAAVVCQEASDLLAGFVDDRHSDSECPVPEERSLVVRDLEREGQDIQGVRVRRGQVMS